jgi:hypothetical protein
MIFTLAKAIDQKADNKKLAKIEELTQEKVTIDEVTYATSILLEKKLKKANFLNRNLKKKGKNLDKKISKIEKSLDLFLAEKSQNEEIFLQELSNRLEIIQA